MKGVFVVGNRQVEVRDIPKPEPGPGQVLVRTVQAGVCGSDLHGYRSDRDNPFVQGHELTGVIESVGPGVEHLEPGRRVMAYQAWGCGYCEYCATGRSNLCSDRVVIGKAHRYQKEYAVMPEAVALPLPDDLSFEDATMLSCAGGTAWGALRQITPRPSCDDAVLVLGLGPVGLMGVYWARAMGALVIGVEANAERLRLGELAGAHAVIDANDGDVVARVQELTLGQGATVGFEGSGSKEAQAMLLEATHWSARVVYVASAPPGPVIDPRVGKGGHLGLRAVHGAFTYSMGDYYDMVRTLRLHGHTPGELVTHQYPVEQAQEAFATADSGNCGKVVLAWDAE